MLEGRKHTLLHLCFLHLGYNSKEVASCTWLHAKTLYRQSGNLGWGQLSQSDTPPHLNPVSEFKVSALHSQRALYASAGELLKVFDVKRRSTSSRLPPDLKDTVERKAKEGLRHVEERGRGAGLRAGTRAAHESHREWLWQGKPPHHL